jgi:hypothetical protein
MPAPTNITLLELCPCGVHLELDEEPHRGHIVTCPVCFDPSAEDAEPIERLAGVGATPADALANYMRRREELCLEPDYTLSELATFIVPPPPEGFVISDQPGGWRPFRDLETAENLCAGAPGVGRTTIFYTQPLAGQKAANQ